MSNQVFDIFNQDAFSAISLTDSINKMPFVPGRVGRLGIFEEQGITTTTVMVEEQNGTLNLIPNTPRGAPANENKHSKRVVRAFKVPHLPLEDTILPDEIQNVRQFGSDSELQGVQSVVDQRMGEMNGKHDATVEFGRLGALKGQILDADGTTVIYNLFTEFNVTQTTIDFLLGTGTTQIRGKCTDVAGAIEDELGMATYSRIHCFAGKTWFKNFIQHPVVQAAFLYFQAQGQDKIPTRDDLRYDGFEFAGITFEQYRGNVGGIQFVADNEAYAFPVGTPNLYKTYFAPADFVEAVNTMGLPRYAKIAIDPMFQRFAKAHTQSNPLSLCKRPKVLVKLITSN